MEEAVQEVEGDSVEVEADLEEAEVQEDVVLVEVPILTMKFPVLVMSLVQKTTPGEGESRGFRKMYSVKIKMKFVA
jgi:hypothetical protein